MGMAWVVVNPTARAAREALAAVRRALAAAGHEVVVRETTLGSPGTDQARDAVAAGAALVVVLGGDGTARAVAAALAHTGVGLAIVPLGTANVVAHNLGLSRRRWRAAVEVAATGFAAPMDLGRASWTTPDGTSHTEPFLTVAGIGRDAATVAATTDRCKARLGWASYFLAGAGHALRAGTPMEVEVDGVTICHRAWSVLVGSVPAVPPGIVVFPHARRDDGHLELAVVDVARPWQWVPIAAKGVLRLRHDVPRLSHHRGRCLTVRPATAQPVQLDGDVVGPAAELRCQVEPAALLVQTAVRGRFDVEGVEVVPNPPAGDVRHR